MPTVRNLGVLWDQVFSYEDHISQLCKSSQFHLWNIGKIRKYLDEGSTEALVNAFVSSKLDYCNSLLFGLPRCLINRLQLVHNTVVSFAAVFWDAKETNNTAARVVTCTRK